MALITTDLFWGQMQDSSPRAPGGHGTRRISEDDIQKTGAPPGWLAIPWGWPQVLPITQLPPGCLALLSGSTLLWGAPPASTRVPTRGCDLGERRPLGPRQALTRRRVVSCLEACSGIFC